MDSAETPAAPGHPRPTRGPARQRREQAPQPPRPTRSASVSLESPAAPQHPPSRPWHSPGNSSSRPPAGSTFGRGPCTPAPRLWPTDLVESRLHRPDLTVSFLDRWESTALPRSHSARPFGGSLRPGPDALPRHETHPYPPLRLRHSCLRTAGQVRRRSISCLPACLFPDARAGRASGCSYGSASTRARGPTRSALRRPGYGAT